MNSQLSIMFVSFAVLALGHGVAFAQSGGFTVKVGDILVANYEGFSVSKIDPGTGVQESLGTFILPTDLVLDPSGNLYISELEGTIQRLDLATGSVTPVLEVGAGPESVYGIALGPQGELYVTSGANDAVYRVDPATGGVTLLSAQTNLVGVVGIDLLDPGHVVVSCSTVDASRLVSVALADGAQSVIASGGQLDQPWGVAVQGGSIFTTAYDSKRILQVSDGTVTELGQTPGFPYGVAIDPEGNIVVGSKGTTDEVRVYAPDGTWLDSFSGGLIRLAAGIEVSRIQVDPALPTAVILQSAATLGTGFADVPATVDAAQRIVRTVRQPGDRIYRLRSDIATRITDIQVSNDQVTLRWE
jgi:hypothetical protein